MNTYYVATLGRCALVEAADESAARVAGHAALYDLYADVRERQGHDVPIEIRTVRLATAEEVEDWKWHPTPLTLFCISPERLWQSRLAAYWQD
jgi:hypothetical protein